MSRAVHEAQTTRLSPCILFQLPEELASYTLLAKSAKVDGIFRFHFVLRMSSFIYADHIVCPQCKYETSLGEKGVEGLRADEYRSDLVNVYTRLNSCQSIEEVPPLIRKEADQTLEESDTKV